MKSSVDHRDEGCIILAIGLQGSYHAEERREGSISLGFECNVEARKAPSPYYSSVPVAVGAYLCSPAVAAAAQTHPGR